MSNKVLVNGTEYNVVKGLLYGWEEPSDIRITDLTNTTWTFNDSLNISDTLDIKSIDFYDGYGQNYTGIRFYKGTEAYVVYRHLSDGSWGGVYYSSSGWVGEKYQTIHINGGTDVRNQELIDWLSRNATLQGGGGTKYEINHGNVLVGGTKRTINFGGDKKPIGGRVFYVDDTAQGATYKFFDANLNEITNQTVSGLANAMYYKISGTPSKDKFYAYCTEDGTPTGSILISDYLKWGGYGTSQGTTADTIGSGKPNSETLINNLGDTSDTIWNWLKNTLNQALKNGCNDWFIGSKAEMDKLRTSGTSATSIFNSYPLWSSVENNDLSVYGWSLSLSRWDNLGKQGINIAVAMRSF